MAARFSAFVAPLLLLALVGPARADDLLGLEDKSPHVVFDVPTTILAHDVSPCDLPATWPNHHLVEIDLPISLRVVSGDLSRVREVVIEITTSADDVLVHDFWPRTTLDTRGVTPIEVTTTKESGRSLEATLGGELPTIGSTAAKVTPSITAAKTGRDVQTEKTTRLPTKYPYVVSGTLGGGRGVFYQLRPTPQATLEGQHELCVQLLVPNSLSNPRLTITASASGSKKVLWMDQAQTWGTAQQTVRVRTIGSEAIEHQVAKVVAEEH